MPVILDVVFEDNHYANILKKEIKNQFIITKQDPIYVNVPNIDSLLGDKLTAFAPKTIGVRPIVEKSDGTIIEKKTEVIKQFFDVSVLCDLIDNFEDVCESYRKTAKAEIKYRNLDIDIEDCLMDTFEAAAAILSKGKISKEDYDKYYLPGIKNLGNFLINARFNAETAYQNAAKVMHIAACIIKNVDPLKNIYDQNLLTGKYSKINFIKKLDKEFFNLAAYSVRLLELEKNQP